MTTSRSAWRWPPRHLVLGVDFGEASARAAAVAGLLASAFDARLVAVHAERFEPPPYFTLEQIARLERDRQTAAAAAAAAEVRAFVARATDYVAEAVIADAPPVDGLLAHAAGADLIVLGTHGRRGPSRWWLGSVAERVVRSSGVPVLVTQAATGPAIDVFATVAIVGGGGAPHGPAHAYAEQLAATFGGRVVSGGTLAECRADIISTATLVVLATDQAAGADSWAPPRAVAAALARCAAPILFVPEPESGK